MKITKKLLSAFELKGYPIFMYDESDDISSVFIRRKRQGDEYMVPVLFIEFIGRKSLHQMIDEIFKNEEARSWCAASVIKGISPAENFEYFLENIEICEPKFNRNEFLLIKGLESYDDLKKLSFIEHHITQYDKEFLNLPECNVW